MSDNRTDIENHVKPNYLLSMLGTKCSRCRRGSMFKHNVSFNLKKNMVMHQHCEVCGQPMEIEVGFYYGTGYVSYAITVAISVALFVAYWVLIGISIDDNSLFYFLAVDIVALIVLMPYTMRLSRAIWLSFFVKYDENWQEKPPGATERIVPEQMNNW